MTLCVGFKTKDDKVYLTADSGRYDSINDRMDQSINKKLLSLKVKTSNNQPERWLGFAFAGNSDAIKLIVNHFDRSYLDLSEVPEEELKTILTEIKKKFINLILSTDPCGSRRQIEVDFICLGYCLAERKARIIASKLKDDVFCEHYMVGKNIPLCLGEKGAMLKYCKENYPTLPCVAKAIEIAQFEYKVRPPLRYGIMDGVDFVYKGDFQF